MLPDWMEFIRIPDLMIGGCHQLHVWRWGKAKADGLLFHQHILRTSGSWKKHRRNCAWLLDVITAYHGISLDHPNFSRANGKTFGKNPPVRRRFYLMRNGPIPLKVQASPGWAKGENQGVCWKLNLMKCVFKDPNIWFSMSRHSGDFDSHFKVFRWSPPSDGKFLQVQPRKYGHQLWPRHHRKVPWSLFLWIWFAVWTRSTSCFVFFSLLARVVNFAVGIRMA